MQNFRAGIESFTPRAAIILSGVRGVFGVARSSFVGRTKAFTICAKVERNGEAGRSLFAERCPISGADDLASCKGWRRVQRAAIAVYL